ncbi:uncharacterized protein MONOS_1165 [Monocercomonoides exilis]|uniref:uncharacterized protein n=1 Tax=Monocercomonoides exilis TaxID=2049356 RepID=UPI00355A61A4|nr:hypothetical protein MONOS_1165 [Monocercomonoides exilis]|eukprot:MONOS_1165.1-p1 / transcript=MONOS_1165.1 / gene=MONOS_1165 / organism=Monocercomonoides_exilis_PA203 / gene_product=unspecified product / transcript_product=unspecified product / location=Mono_scaffold00020:586-1094(+) / protein_length=115 / sequence_SO=supercontig / SO=protein_coding / is_pseudo=false
MLRDLKECGGFGAEDKFHNLWESGGADPNLTVRVKYDQIGYYRYTTGMNLTDADSKLYQPVGEPGPAGPLPTSISMEEDNEEVSGGTGNEPRGSDGASGSIPGPSSSFTILHDD